jgi:DNA-binding response OmpR family regulator
MDICEHCGQAILHDKAEAVALDGMVEVTSSAVIMEGRNVTMTPQELHLVEALAHSRHTFLIKEQIMNYMMQKRGFPADEPEMKIVDVIICKVRKKMRDAGITKVELYTKWGVGYGLRLTEQPTAPADYLVGDRPSYVTRVEERARIQAEEVA